MLEAALHDAEPDCGLLTPAAQVVDAEALPLPAIGIDSSTYEIVPTEALAEADETLVRLAAATTFAAPETDADRLGLLPSAADVVAAPVTDAATSRSSPPLPLMTAVLRAEELNSIRQPG